MNLGGGDLTASSGSSGSWMEPSSIRRRRLSSTSPSAFLTPAFDACASPSPHSTTSFSSSSGGGGGGSGGSLDLDLSLLRYTRSRHHLSPCESSDPGSTSTRRRLHCLLQLRSSLSSLPSPSVRGSCSSSSASPLSPIDDLPPAKSPPAYKTPVKMEVWEDVVVMDGVLVSDAGSTSGRGLPKTDVCRAWDENGVCRYGSKCQFAHGKEELRSGRSMKQKYELPVTRPGRSRSPYFSLLPSAPAAGGTTRIVAAAPPAATAASLTSEADCKRSATRLPPPRSAAEPSFQWPPTDAEDAQITQVLYGPSPRRRLPAFTQFCPLK